MPICPTGSVEVTGAPVCVPVRWRIVAARIWPFALALLACLPAAPWVYARWTSPTGSAIGAVLLPLTIIGWLRVCFGPGHKGDRASQEESIVWMLGGATFFGLFGIAYHGVPRLVSTELAACGLACAMLAGLSAGERRRSWAIPILVTFSIPLGPSFQFYLGYPLRVLAARLAALMIGSHVHALGTGISDGVHTVFIDSPCSGIRMLTTSLILAAGAAFFLRLPRVRTVCLIASGLLLAVLGNALRGASLLIMETRIPVGTREDTLIGISVFAGCALALVSLAWVLKEKASRGRYPSPASRWTVGSNLWLSRVRDAFARSSRFVFIVSCLFASTAPWRAGTTDQHTVEVSRRSAWPKTWNGHALTSVPLEPSVREALRGFPGDVVQFEIGDTGTKVLLRRCREATRHLHPAEDCYRVQGWKCVSMPAIRDEAGHLWSRFEVIRSDGSRSRVRQCYFSISPDASPSALEDLIGASESWPDVSSWYWNAAKPGSSVRMTLAVTVSE